MDLELSDEQTWLAESVESMLARDWVAPGDAGSAGEADRRRLWQSLVSFGALAVDREDGLATVDVCLIARALGARLASVPYLGSAAVRLAIEPLAAELPDGFARLSAGDDAVSVALLEPGRGWLPAGVQTALEPDADGDVLRGRKLAVEHAATVDRLAVVASADGEPAVALVPAGAPGVALAVQPALDATTPMHSLELPGVRMARDDVADGEAGRRLVERLVTIGALLAAAEAVGAAGHLLDDACRYAGERRQFGRAIGSFQALRHLLADMYVRQASSWSSVLYAAAALDEQADDAAQTAAIAKAYVARAAREVAHGAIQVFGGIALTAEHPAHRYLRRVVVREQQFGDAAHHERELGRALAAARTPERVG